MTNAVEERVRDLFKQAMNCPSGIDILGECLDLAGRLIEKNISYGNSALEPSRIFSKGSAVEQLYTQIDHKLSRISRGAEFVSEDTIFDLTAYLILLRIAIRQD